MKNGESTLKRLDYEPLTLVRPPENQYNKDVVKHINNLGYRTVFWSVYAHIQQSTDANQKAKSISGELSKGDIVLFSAQDHLTATPKVIKNIIKAKKVRILNLSRSRNCYHLQN
ncbi:hypothetical protein [Piscibacillus salipiscarius]|uniref:hypothetical protein n=1 Tax=Piscibacillus salipiscarius TaxID=299480 RepID=UPI0034E2F321